jgi:hydroxyacylglutathione hydrolase
MIFHQFEAKGLSQFSYAVGSKTDAEVAIVDPERDIQTYINYAAENRLKIKYVIETHIHADYASGAHELAQKTGAELLLSAYDEGEKYSYAFPHRELHDGERIEIGGATLEILHTPGHTPEHISILVYSREKGDHQPTLMLSGDFLFIGSVGRPDLLGEADKTPLAKKLYHSVTSKLKGLPDELEIYPGHGAGSLCGAGMSSAVSSTLGDERKNNPYLQKMSEDAFVEKILSNSPPFPEYYKRMKEENSKGPTILDGLPKPQPMDATQFREAAIGKKATILDVRHPLAFGGGHVEGSINIATLDHVSFWSPWIIPYNQPIYLVLDGEEKLRDTLQALVRVGLDDVRGYLKPNFNHWVNRGNDFDDLTQVSVHYLSDVIDMGIKPTVIDVRNESEWKEGHIAGAKHIYLGDIPTELKNLPDKDAEIYCICGGGFRSSVAASLLLNKGYENVYNVFGGMTAWKAAGLEMSKK